MNGSKLKQLKPKEGKSFEAIDSLVHECLNPTLNFNTDIENNRTRTRVRNKSQKQTGTSNRYMY